MKDQVIEEIKRLCGKVEWMPGIGHCFLIKDTVCMYMFCADSNSIRFAIPYLAKATKNNKEKMLDLVNKTNREVKYIKAALLDNGNLTLMYDHKIVEGEKPCNYVHHIIRALEFASGYIEEKIKTH